MEATKDKLNGYPVIMVAANQPREGYRLSRIVMVDRGEDEPGPRFVTAVHCYGDHCWCWGHYIETLTEARQDFGERVERGY